jgi:hypothetical protein
MIPPVFGRNSPDGSGTRLLPERRSCFSVFRSPHTFVILMSGHNHYSYSTREDQDGPGYQLDEAHFIMPSTMLNSGPSRKALSADRAFFLAYLVRKPYTFRLIFSKNVIIAIGVKCDKAKGFSIFHHRVYAAFLSFFSLLRMSVYFDSSFASSMVVSSLKT